MAPRRGGHCPRRLPGYTRFLVIVEFELFDVRKIMDVLRNWTNIAGHGCTIIQHLKIQSETLRRTMKLRVFYKTPQGWEISRALGPTRENVKLTKIFQVTVARASVPTELRSNILN